MLWAFVRQRLNVFLGAVAVIAAGMILSSGPLLWPLGALAAGAAVFARPALARRWQEPPGWGSFSYRPDDGFDGPIFITHLTIDPRPT